MPRSQSERTDVKRSSNGSDKRLPTRTKKQIDSLPEHAQHIYKKTHDNAIEQYQNPDKDAGVRVKVLKKWHTKLPGRK